MFGTPQQAHFIWQIGFFVKLLCVELQSIGSCVTIVCVGLQSIGSCVTTVLLKHCFFVLSTHDIPGKPELIPYHCSLYGNPGYYQSYVSWRLAVIHQGHTARPKLNSLLHWRWSNSQNISDSLEAVSSYQPKAL